MPCIELRGTSHSLAFSPRYTDKYEELYKMPPLRRGISAPFQHPTKFTYILSLLNVVTAGNPIECCHALNSYYVIKSLSYLTNYHFNSCWAHH